MRKGCINWTCIVWKLVSEQADELHRTEKEKNYIAAEKKDVAKAVTSLEVDLLRVNRNAETFCHDLK